jgi:hypothetical protein
MFVFPCSGSVKIGLALFSQNIGIECFLQKPCQRGSCVTLRLDAFGNAALQDGATQFYSGQPLADWTYLDSGRNHAGAR